MYKLTPNPKWYKRAAALEEGYDISAGVEVGGLSIEQRDASKPLAAISGDVPRARLAFSIIMSNLRVSKGLTVEKLARKLDVDVDQLVLLERQAGYKAPPRTLMKLAEYYDIPKSVFLQMAGVMTEVDQRLEEDLVRYAAESGSFETLNREEKKLINKLVKTIRDYSTKDE